MTHIQPDRATTTPPGRHHGIESVTDILDQVIETAQAETVTLRQVIERIGNASFAPILLLPALAVATPLSGIPLFSSLMGVVICLVATQMLIRRQHVWLPNWVLHREMKGDVVRKAFHKLYPAARWIDAKTGSRFRIFAHRPLVFIPQLVCVCSGALMPVLEFVPFSSSVMGVGVALLSLGMLTRDGIIIVFGLLPYSVVGWLIFSAVT